MPGFIRPILVFLFLLICNDPCLAQKHVLKQVPGLPSNEIYDIFTDSKGFLWIAHNAGISKYDGISFTNFSNPLQSSLATSNILEDKHGRIWFMNFTGQIFYIENGHMNLLTAYKSETESYFPRMGLLNDLLVATTEKGLFICNTNTLECHYEHCLDCSNRPRSISVILCILKDKVLAFGDRNCYIYRPGKGLKLAVLDDQKRWSIIESIGASMCTRSFNDTAFLFSSPTNLLYKLKVVGDTVKICETKQFDNFINTVSIIKNDYWINTINVSISGTRSSDVIKGYDISCITIDKEGHRWYGSLQQGLLTDSVTTNTPQNKAIFSPAKGDVIKCMAQEQQTLLLGTQNGLVISYDTKTNKQVILARLPENGGGITYLKWLKDEKILIGMPLLTYLFDTRSHSLKNIDPMRAIKEADQVDGAILGATSSNMIILPDKDDNETFNKFKRKFKGLADFTYPYLGTRFRMLRHRIRSRAICYSPADQTIWVSFKNGLHTVNSLGLKRFYYRNSPLYTSCLTAYGDAVIAGTSGNGVVIIRRDNIRQLTTNDGLLSNDIVNVRVINKNLWVYSSRAVQLFDLQSLRLIYKYSFPDPNAVPITDANELNNKCYFISSDGLYRVTPVHKKSDSVSIYLNALFINRKDTGFVDNLALPHSSNDIQVSLGTPYLLNAKDVVIRYALVTGNDARWIYARHGERNFHFASLAPGAYSFQAQAIKLQTGQASKSFIINFTIAPPWWQTWLFRIASIVIIALVVFAIIRIYYLNQLRKQQVDYEKKLIIERERQHISREIHDNIGQALSVIKLNLDMTDPSEVSDVKELIGEVIQDLRQFTHGLYYGKLLTDSLFEVIKKDVERLNNSGQLVALLDIKIDKTPLGEQTELLIYRIFQEAINNILKHARAKNVLIKIRCDKKQFKLIISDDGQGFSVGNHDKGLGLDSMYKRAELLKGQLSIDSKPGEGTKIELVIDHSQNIN